MPNALLYTLVSGTAKIVPANLFSQTGILSSLVTEPRRGGVPGGVAMECATEGRGLSARSSAGQANDEARDTGDLESSG